MSHHPVLDRVFGQKSMSLLEYLLQQFPEALLLGATDSAGYRRLLTMGRICIPESNENEEFKLVPTAKVDEKNTILTPEMMRDVLQKVLEANMKHNRASVLTFGYSLLGFTATGLLGNLAIENEHLNTLHNRLQGEPWSTLLSRVRADTVFNLLVDKCVFESLPNNCLLQVSGPPLKQLLPDPRGAVRTSHVDPASGKRMNFSEQFLRRDAVFFNDSHYKTYGLPLQHLLNSATRSKAGARSVLASVFGVRPDGRGLLRAPQEVSMTKKKKQIVVRNAGKIRSLDG